MKLTFSQAINEIRNRLDILGVAEKYLQVKRSGRSYVSLCPFHNDSKPSMHINPEKGIFKCFSCGAGGDLFKFVSEYEKISFSETVHQLADQCGIEIITHNNKTSSEEEKRKAPFYKLNEIACDFFRAKLTDSITEYLTAKRQLSLQTIEEFSLGYSPPSPGKLLQHCKEKGFNDPEILKASGLFSSEGELRERFRGRLMIPVQDVEGRIIAFGARALQADQQPKYLNSPETPIYQKGEHLFCLDKAKAHSRQERRVLLLEGYFDVIQAHQAGIKYAVASLGTALTSAQASLLYGASLSRLIILGFDNDQAGLRAIENALRVFQHGKWSREPDLEVLELGRHKDIDEYLQQEGIESLLERLNNCRGVYDFLFDNKAADNPEDRLEAVESLLELLGQIKDPLKKEILIEECARRFSFTKEALLQKISSSQKKTSPKQKTSTGTKRENQLLSPEKLLATLFISDDSSLKLRLQNLKIADEELLFIREKLLQLDSLDERLGLLSEEGEDYSDRLSEIYQLSQSIELEDFLREEKAINAFRRVINQLHAD